jgi:hypothetical protein
MSEVILNKYDVVLADKNEWEAAAALAVSKGYVRVGDKLEAPETGALVGHWSNGATSAKGGWVCYVEMTGAGISDEQGYFEKATGLPPLRDDLKDFEKAAGLSVDVLIKFKRFSNVVIGRYLHGIEEWQANGVGGSYDADSIEEWWLMPVIGTGTVPMGYVMLEPWTNTDEGTQCYVQSFNGDRVHVRHTSDGAFCNIDDDAYSDCDDEGVIPFALDQKKLPKDRAK